MIAWELVDSARMSGDNGKLDLFKRGREFSIRMNGRELMNSRLHGSEETLSKLACARIADRRRGRILIGGLGMGFTLAAALKRLGPEYRVDVCELVPQVVAWNRGPLAHLASRPLEDRRVTVLEEDVVALLQEERTAYDAILLDVDNGPEAFSSKGNGWLYSPAGLSASFAALRPGGVLAVWSSGPEKNFAGRLRRAGFAVEKFRAPAREGGKGGRHTIWIALARYSPKAATRPPRFSGQ